MTDETQLLPTIGLPNGGVLCPHKVLLSLLRSVTGIGRGFKLPPLGKPQRWQQLGSPTRQ